MFSTKKLSIRRKELGYSQSAISKMLGLHRSACSNWELGKAKPNQKHISLLAEILQVEESYFESEYEIVTNYLQLHPHNQVKAEQYVEDLLATQQKDTQKVIQLYPVQVLSDVALSAGPGEGFFDELETETVYSTVEQSGYDFAAWVSGTSMEPVYQNGEVALIRATGFDYDGAVYALSWNGSLYIKKLYLEEKGFRMVSINKDSNPDRFIPFEDEPRIVGIVVSHFMPVVGG